MCEHLKAADSLKSNMGPRESVSVMLINYRETMQIQRRVSGG